jgi:hypothetical protein
MWLGHGRFHRAGIRYAQMSGLPRTMLTGSPGDGQLLVIAGDHTHYRQLCTQAVKRIESDPDLPWDLSRVTYDIALLPDSGVDAETRIRMARRGYDLVSADPGASRFRALLALGAAQVRAGAAAQAEPHFREVIAHAPKDQEWLGARAAAWLAIASWHQGRREESRTWFGQIDHYIRARLPNGRPDLDHRTPLGQDDWCYLLIAWREAHGLLLDGDFPADPFAR